MPVAVAQTIDNTKPLRTLYSSFECQCSDCSHGLMKQCYFGKKENYSSKSEDNVHDSRKLELHKTTHTYMKWKIKMQLEAHRGAGVCGRKI